MLIILFYVIACKDSLCKYLTLKIFKSSDYLLITVVSYCQNLSCLWSILALQARYVLAY